MARLTLTARADGGEPSGTSVALTAIATGTNVELTATADSGPLAQLMPAQFDRFQRLRWLLELDDVKVEHAHGVSWSSSIERPIQIASCRVPGDSVRRLGTILPTGAPIGGLRPVDLSLVYRQDNGAEFTEPLITNGLIVESPHDYRPSGIVDELAIHDATARVVHKQVSRSYAAGSNTARETAVAQLAGDAGISASERDIPDMAGSLRKAVDLDAGDALDLAQAIAEVPGFRLLRNRQGIYTGKRLAPESESRNIRWVFTPADWLQSAGGTEYGYQVRATPDAYTRAETRGSRQVMRVGDGIPPSPGPVTIVTEGPFDPNALPFRQNSDISLPITLTYTATGHTVPAQDRVLSRTEIRFSGNKIPTGDPQAYLAAIRLIQEAKTEGYYNRQRARVERGTDDEGTLSQALVAYVTGESLDRPGYVAVADSWMKISEESEVRIYTGEGSVSTDPRWLKERTVERYGWYNPRVRIKNRNSVTDPWEAATASSSYFDLGNGEGVKFSSEQYLLLERETETYRRWNGLQIERHLIREAYGRRPGALYLYSDGEFGDSEETFREVYSERERWRKIGEGRWVKVLDRYGVDGQRVGDMPSTFEYTNQGPPTNDTLTIGDADRFEQQEISGDADGSALEAVRPEHRFGPAVFEYAETEDELQRLAERFLLMSNGALLTFWIPPNPRVEVGDWVRFVGPPGSGLHHACKVVETGITGGDGAPIVQQVLAETYPEIN